MEESNRPDAIKRELEEQSPLLAKLKQAHPRDGFAVPDQYFQQNKLELMQAVRAELAKPRRHIDWWRSSKLALAASIAILIAVGAYLFWPATADKDINFENFTTEEMASYIRQNLDEFDEELMVDYVSPGANRWSILSGEQFSQDELDQLYKELLDEVELEDLL